MKYVIKDCLGNYMRFRDCQDPSSYVISVAERKHLSLCRFVTIVDKQKEATIFGFKPDLKDMLHCGCFPLGGDRVVRLRPKENLPTQTFCSCVGEISMHGCFT